MRYFVRAGFSSLDSNLDFIFVVSTMLLNEIIVVNLMWREKVMQQPRGGRSVRRGACRYMGFLFVRGKGRLVQIELYSFYCCSCSVFTFRTLLDTTINYGV